MTTVTGLGAAFGSLFGKIGEKKDLGNGMFLSLMQLTAPLANPNATAVPMQYALTATTAAASTGNAAQKAHQAMSAYQNGSDVVREFLDWQAKSPEEKMIDAILAEMGLTREQVEAMPPEERAKVMAEVEERLKQKIEEAMGVRTTKEAKASPAVPAVKEAAEA